MIINLLAREFDGFRASFRAQADAFHEVFPEIEVRFHFYPVETVEDQMVRGDQTPLNVDVFLCSTDWLPHLIEGGRLLPLNDYLVHDPPENWPGDWALSLLQLQTRDAITSTDAPLGCGMGYIASYAPGMRQKAPRKGSWGWRGTSFHANEPFPSKRMGCV